MKKSVRYYYFWFRLKVDTWESDKSKQLHAVFSVGGFKISHGHTTFVAITL